MEEQHKIVAIPISELYVTKPQISKPKLYLQNFICITEDVMMAKDDNLSQVHKLAAVLEDADKVKVKPIRKVPTYFHKRNA